MKVDIIISILNGADYIEEAIKSIIDQTYDDWQLFLINNGSTDNTLRIIESYQKKYDNKIFVTSYKKNEKPSYRWMEKISSSTSDVIAISCHDDIWKPNKLEKQIVAIKEYNVDIVHTNVDHIDSSGNLMEGKASKENNYRNSLNYFKMSSVELANEFCVANSIRLSSVLIKNNAFKKHGGWEQGIWGGEDWGLWIKFAANNYSFYHIKNSLVLRRVHAKNASSTSRYERSFGFIKSLEIVKKNYSFLEESILKKETKIYERIIFQTIRRKEYKVSRKYSKFFISKKKKSFRDVLFIALAYSGFLGNFILRIKKKL